MNLNRQCFWHYLMCCLPPTPFFIMEKAKKRDCFPGEVYVVLRIEPRTSYIAGHKNQNGGGCAGDLGHRALRQQGWVLNAKQTLGHFPCLWKPENHCKYNSIGKSQPKRET